MRVSLIKIGNSQGVRIPKPLIEEVGLREEIEMSVEGSALVLRPIKHPRDGWEAALAALNALDDDEFVDDFTATEFDESEWQWE